MEKVLFIQWIVAASDDAHPSEGWSWLTLCKPVVKALIKNYITEIQLKKLRNKGNKYKKHYFLIIVLFLLLSVLLKLSLLYSGDTTVQ